MTDSMLFTLGTPFGRWPTVASAFLDAAGPGLLDPAIAGWHQQVVGAPGLEINGVDVLGSLQRLEISPPMLGQLAARRPPGLSLWGGADARMCWTAQRLADAFPAARFLIWVDNPTLALAHWLSGDGNGDPARALALFESASQSIVRLLHRYLPRCLVVYTDDVLTQPAALARRLSAWLALDLPDVPAPALASPDALCMVIAEQLVAAHAGLQSSYTRLYASCTQLLETAEAPTSRSLEDGTIAVHSYRQLLRQATMDAALVTRLRAAEEERERLRASLDQGLHDRELLLVQARNDLESISRRHQEITNQLRDLQHAHATAGAEVVKLQSVHRAACADRDAARQDAQKAQRDLETLERSHREALTARDTAAMERDAAREETRGHMRENELMLMQLHQAQEELEHCYLAHRDLQAAASASGEPLNTIMVERLEVLAARDTLPHRELVLVLHGVKAPDRSLRRIDIRLVEHHGRPGLAFFQSDDEHHPLMAWDPTGVEYERAYVLLVPADDPSNRLLQRLGTADWRFIQGVASHVASSLDDAVASRWRVVALRLRQQLKDLPERFRFDSVDVTSDASAQGALLVTFGNAAFGARQTTSLRLRWWPRRSGGESAIDLLLPDSDDLPLFRSWPVKEDGDWRDAWSLPLSGARPASLEHRWRAIPRMDRDLLLGLLDALPAAAHQAVQSGVVNSHDAKALIAAASRPLRTVHRLMHGTRLRRVMRALGGLGAR